ncbi:uncharacterized protein LOC131946432 [Physella acuta]|uniref:uncharacterized protein LOC131946432 n=1 Tax=Physella acuta TaxID=109671 RepID=UPI0027DC5D1F|nr:uncharacterized protein LOC131946432 [Physella acuta]XP_059163176.1 uncharacterized protein LOC131946432 [Physella acuta]
MPELISIREQATMANKEVTQVEPFSSTDLLSGTSKSLDFDIDLLSPDDGNDESGLTIDLSHDDTDGSRAVSPVPPGGKSSPVSTNTERQPPADLPDLEPPLLHMSETHPQGNVKVEDTGDHVPALSNENRPDVTSEDAPHPRLTEPDVKSESVSTLNSPDVTSAPSATPQGPARCSECQSLHAGSGNCAGCGVWISSSTKTTTTVTSASPSTTKTTTSSSLTSTPAPGDVGVPLDLCLKKSESLGTVNARTKGNPPVQMVLPQVQLKTATMSSPFLGLVSSQTSMDLKVAVKTAIPASQLAQAIDSIQTDVSDENILSTKPQQRNPMGSEFKVERSFPMHNDTLDLCMKTSGGIAMDSPKGQLLLGEGGDGALIDESITIGLALSAELETETDMDRNSRLVSRDVEPSLVTLTQPEPMDTSLKSDVMDVPMSLTSSYQSSKTMTDAELDQEFQKHLIEFKALEKLAERKAQEQMQVAIMRKRKAEQLRIMEMKKAKRDIDRMGHFNALSLDADKSFVPAKPGSSLTPTSALTTVSTLTLLTHPPTPSSLIPSPAHTHTPSKTPPGTAAPCQTVPAPTATEAAPKPVPQISVLDSPFTKSETAFNKSETVFNKSETVFNKSETVFNKSETVLNKSETAFNKSETTVNKNETALSKGETALPESDLKVAGCIATSQSVVKTEVSEVVINPESNPKDVDTSKVKCKTEVLEVDIPELSETVNENLKTVEPSGIPASSNEGEKTLEVSSKTPDLKQEQHKTESPSAHKQESDAEKKTDSEKVLKPVPAHQNQPQTAPLDMTHVNNSAYFQGPYHRRNVAILEPPFLSKEAPKDDQPQKAHSQRPFQTAGNLIVAIGGSFASSTSCSTTLPSSAKYSTSQIGAPLSTTSRPTPQGSKPQPTYRSIAPRPIKNSDSSSAPMSAPSGETTLIRAQRKSLDESELRERSHPVLDSGPKSADQVNKPQPSFQLSSAGAPDKRFFSKPESIGPPPPLQQHQQNTLQRPVIQSHPIPPSLQPNDRPSFGSDDGEKKSAFKVHVRPQNNLIIDLTKDVRTPSDEKATLVLPGTPTAHTQPGFNHQTSPDPLQYARQDALGRRPQAYQPSLRSRLGAPGDDALFEFAPGQDKSNALPNGFNDRSRPGGFITTRHRLPAREPVREPVREPARPVPVKDPFFRDHVRPSVSSVTQHRQRYSSNPPGMADPQMPAQTTMGTTFHKPDELSPRFSSNTHVGMSWVDEQHATGSEFASSQGQWRGHSPGNQPRSSHLLSNSGLEMFPEGDVGNRLLAEEMDKQRGRGEVHPAFQKHSDLLYKQQKHLQLEVGPLFNQQSISHSGVSHTHTLPPHTSLHSSVAGHHPQPITSQTFQQRPPLPAPGSLGESYMRHAQLQQQQKKLRTHPPLDGNIPSWRSYGSVDNCSLGPSGLQPRSPYLQNPNLNQNLDAITYQKLHQQQQQQQIMQQQQQYQFHQLQQGLSTQKSIASGEIPSPTNQRMSLVAPPHGGQNLGIPQLMFGECSSSPNYPNLSPNSAVNAGLMMGQNPGLHHRPTEAEHLAMLHQQRQQSKPTMFDRPRQVAPQTQGPSGMPPGNMPPIPVPPRPVAGYGGMVPGQPSSVTNSLCRVCGKLAVYLCSSCRRVWYCNQTCQSKHWGIHAAECKPLS